MSRRPAPTGLDWEAVTASYVAHGGELHPEVWGGRPAPARKAASKPRKAAESSGSKSNNPLGRGATVEVSRADLADIIARYKAGEGGPSIAERHGIAANTVLRLLREAGVPIRPKGCPVELLPEYVRGLAARYVAGETISEIADAEGLGRKTLSRAFSLAGIARRTPSEAKKLAVRRSWQAAAG